MSGTWTRCATRFAAGRPLPPDSASRDYAAGVLLGRRSRRIATAACPALALLSALILAAPAGAAAGFGKPAHYPAGEDAWGLGSGDFNRDGRPDLAVGDFNSGMVSVLVGAGGGSFGAPTSLPTSGNPESLAVGRLDGGKDLDVAAGTNGSVSVFFGAPGAAFAPEAPFGSYGLATQARGTLVRDFNRDGKNDIVVSNDTHQLALLRGNGDGTFRAQQNYDFAPSTAGQLAAGRINGDKRPDVVMAGSGARSIVVSVARKGSRVFKKPKRYPGPVDVTGIAVGDLNRDGRSDIVAVGGGSGKGGASNPKLYVLIARKGGGFRNAAITFLSGVYATDLTLADLNVDGRLDAIVTHANGRLDILHGKGDGTLGSPRSVKSGTDTPQTIALRLNGDSRPDLVVAGGSQNSVSVLLAKH